MNTPNLDKLMEQATPGPWNGYIGQDGAFEITGTHHEANPPLTVLCQRSPWPHRANTSRANGKLIQLFGTHGPALVAELKDIIEMHNTGRTGNLAVCVFDATQLLIKLDQEATCQE